MEISRKTKTKLLIGLIITVLFSLFMWIRFAPLEILEEKLYDYRFKVRGPLKPSEQILIAAIDERSIERLGRWPWSRDTLAQMVNRLVEEGAEVIVLILSSARLKSMTGSLERLSGRQGM